MKSELSILHARSIYHILLLNLTHSILNQHHNLSKRLIMSLRLAPHEQNASLKKILVTYGHVYSRRVVLDGRLYHTEGHRVKGIIEEQGMLVTTESRFSILLTRPTT